MAYYAYKQVRDLIPERITDAMGEYYEGSPDMDGDLWIAAAAYILELEKQRANLLESAKKLLEVMSGRQAEQDYAFQMFMLQDAIANSEGEIK